MAVTATKMNIYQSVNKVMEDIGAVGKNSKNQSQGFMFRGIDAVMNALQPALVKNRVFVVPDIIEQSREERKTAKGGTLIYSICKIRYTFYAEDGSYVEAVTIGEGMDSGDKATNKAMAIAFKYACFQVFCIPTEEMKDPDEESPEVIGEKTKIESAKQEKPLNDTEDPNIDQAKINTIKSELVRTGLDESTILKICHIKSLNDMTTTMFMMVMKKFNITPDKEAKKNE